MSMAKIADRLILVTGATGKQGGAVLRHLQQRGFPVRVLARDPDKPSVRALIGHGTEVVQGDLNDAASLARAMDGVYGVYSVQTSRQAGGEDTEVRQGIQIVEEARRARVSHLVYSSVGSADQKTGIPHFETKFKIEEQIRTAGVPYTIFRPVFFMENWLFMRQGIEQGRLALPLKPETRLQMIAVDDIGAFAAMAFEHVGHWQGRAFELAGDELSMTELTAAFSRTENRAVQYAQVPWEDFQRQVGPDLGTMWKWFEDVGYHVDIAGVRQEYPRLTSFERWMRAAFAAA
jgi:uncharacterized protein YbjT (DUF2867 family)